MGRDGLNGYKANLSPAKLKLVDIGLELSLAKVSITIKKRVLENTYFCGLSNASK